MKKQGWLNNPWLLVTFSGLAGAVAARLLEDWTAVKETFGVLFALLVLAAASWLLVVLHRDDQRKQEAHREDLVRIRQETAKIREERAKAREAKAEEQRVEKRWEEAAEQLWSDETSELIVASTSLTIQDPVFGEALAKVRRHLGEILGHYLPIFSTGTESYLFRGFLAHLERITAQLPPSAENARLVWETAKRWGDYRHLLRDAEHIARSRNMCGQCAFFTRTLPEQVQN